ncbi:MAG: MarR family transcriptional regulator [Anaerolineae bacterium]|nr:MarR family transcriptional regulator [Anaerolineae bacterium]
MRMSLPYSALTRRKKRRDWFTILWQINQQIARSRLAHLCRRWQREQRPGFEILRHGRRYQHRPYQPGYVPSKPHE